MFDYFRAFFQTVKGTVDYNRGYREGYQVGFADAVDVKANIERWVKERTEDVELRLRGATPNQETRVRV